MIRGAAIGLTVFALTGCVSSEPVPVLHNVCPPLAVYSANRQAEAARELEGILKVNPKAELPTFMTDYARLRAALRTCRS